MQYPAAAQRCGTPDKPDRGHRRGVARLDALEMQVMNLINAPTGLDGGVQAGAEVISEQFGLSI